MREMSPDFAEYFEEDLLRVLETGEEPAPAEFSRDFGSAGEVRNFMLRYYPVPRPDGTRAVGCVVMEITDQKSAWRAQQISEERFRDLADLLPQTVFEIDLEGRILYANRCGLESFGYTQQELENGVRITDLFPEKEQPRMQESLGLILRGGEVTSHEYMARRRDGTPFPVNTFTSPIIRDGKPTGFRESWSTSPSARGWKTR